MHTEVDRFRLTSVFAFLVVFCKVNLLKLITCRMQFYAKINKKRALKAFFVSKTVKSKSKT